MICFPKDVVNADEANLGAANNPCRESVPRQGVNVPRKGVRRVPVNHRKEEMEGTKRRGSGGENIRERCVMEKVEI